MKAFHTIPGATLLSLLLLLFVSACAATQNSGSSSNRNLLTSEEIQQASQYSNAYEIVQNLRPQWLRKRGRHSIYNEGTIVVYLDDIRYGSPEALREISAEGVRSIQFLGAAQASNRYGLDHDHGAILVKTL